MLVYLKQDMSYTTIDGHRIYGRKYSYSSMGPTNVSLDLYKEYIDILDEASYDKYWLESKYNGIFPNISFKLSELNKIDFNTLVVLAKLIGIKYIKTKNKPNKFQRAALIHCVVNRLNKEL